MGAQIISVMTTEVMCVPQDTSMSVAAAVMRDNDIGSLIILNEGRISGIVTDRDLVVRGLAEDLDPSAAPVMAAASPSTVCISSDSSTAEAVRRMRENSVRRLPVCDSSGHPLGIVSLGDLAEAMDPDSALADISTATANV